MSMLRHAVWFLALAALACADARTGRPAAQPDPFPAAYDAGRAEAEAEFAQQGARWLRLSQSGDWDQQSGLDVATGLPWVAVDPSDPASRGRVEGHNAVLAEYVQQHGLPANSRKPWEPQLLDLKGYFAARAKEEKPLEVPLDGPAVMSPDRAVAFAWRRTPRVGEPTSLVLVRGERQGSVLPTLPATRDGGSIEFVWGPPGADVAVFHWRAPDAPAGEREGYSALDLRSGLWLRHERVAGSGATS